MLSKEQKKESSNSISVFVLASDVDFAAVRPDGRGRIVSVFLSRGGGKHNFRCIECGKINFQYSGSVDFIFDGAAIPKKKAEVDILCYRCKIIYRVI